MAFNEDQTLDQITESEINGVLYRLAVQHSIVVDDDRIYRATQYEEERRTAMMIAKRLMKQIPAESIEKELEEAQKVLGITLSDCQKEAVRMVFRSPISIITGGPGTGKTTVLKVILYIHKEKYKKSVANMLVEWKAEQDEVKEVLGEEYIDYNLVMATTFGNPIGTGAIRGQLKKLIEEHNLPPVVFHSLRHSSVTYKLKLNGGDIKAVQGDSGHSQVDMVTDVYSHIIDEDRRRNAELFEEAFYEKKNLDPKMHDETTS